MSDTYNFNIVCILYLKIKNIELSHFNEINNTDSNSLNIIQKQILKYTVEH